MSTLLEDMLKVLEIRETASLLSHEQTISPNLKKLKEGMLNIGHLVDPLVVDGRSGVVLDGNHRLKVLEIIECPLSACQVVDYGDPQITVGTWLPVSARKPEEMLKGRENITLEKVEREEGMKAVNELRAPFLVADGENSYLVNPGRYKLMEMVEEQAFVLSHLKDADLKYVPDNEAGQYVGKGSTVFHRRAYTKEEIIKAAKAHAPFPPKSTRHLIPGRIIRLNMKLGWLHRSAKDARAELERMLGARAYNGNVRKYYEPVIVIY